MKETSSSMASLPRIPPLCRPHLPTHSAGLLPNLTGTRVCLGLPFGGMTPTRPTVTGDESSRDLLTSHSGPTRCATPGGPLPSLHLSSSSGSRTRTMKCDSTVGQHLTNNLRHDMRNVYFGACGKPRTPSCTPEDGRGTVRVPSRPSCDTQCDPLCACRSHVRLSDHVQGEGGFPVPG